MKSSSSTHPSAAATATTTVAIRDHLSPLLPLLDAFNHRNKNQHHASHWWSHFSILRRALRTLLVSPTSRQASSVALLSRVRWLRDRIIPRAYIPFSQLAADNQYAPLGLVLLAILARVSSVLSELMPLEQSTRPGQGMPATAKVSPPSRSSAEADRGVAVSRGDMNLAVPATPTITSPPTSREVVEASVAPSHQPKKRSKTKTKNKRDELSNLFGAL